MGRRWAGIVVAVGVALAVITPAAGAAAATGRACVVRVGTGGTAASTTCHPTLAAALAAATGGRVAAAAPGDPAFDSRVDAADDAQAAAAGDVVIGIEYADRDFGGDAWVITAAGPCRSDHAVDWQISDLAGTGWNDRISSFHTYARCSVNHFAGADFTGARTGPRRTDTFIGPRLNDRTSSLQWS